MKQQLNNLIKGGMSYAAKIDWDRVGRATFQITGAILGSMAGDKAYDATKKVRQDWREVNENMYQESEEQVF